jgi:radical SAM protein (TIGR01212 family)
VGEIPWRAYSAYLRERHGCKVYRIAVDAGFSCPNRGGSRFGRGCTFCADHGARAPYLGEAPDLECQVRRSIAFLRRRYGAEAFILFFQAYSNTNAPVERLRRIYDEGLALERFRGMNVATRPDCIDAARADLLASYQRHGLEVWCELGLQSANDETLRRISRGHTWEDFRRAHRLLKERGVRAAAHLIFGLPGEGRAEIMATVDALAALGIDGVKLHNLHIPVGTAMAREYAAGEITAPTAERHRDYVVEAIERLPPETVIMRIQCDTQRAALAAPRYFWDKARFAEQVAARMRERGTYQGRLFRASAGRGGTHGEEHAEAHEAGQIQNLQDSENA